MMRSTTHHLSISIARADALFVSALQRSQEPSKAQVRAAIAAAIGEFGAQGCAARVAQEYGEHPETAAPRMRWVRAVLQAYGEVRNGDAQEARDVRKAGAINRAGEAGGALRRSTTSARCAA
jgi:hypothetical protein